MLEHRNLGRVSSLTSLCSLVYCDSYLVGHPVPVFKQILTSSIINVYYNPVEIQPFHSFQVITRYDDIWSLSCFNLVNLIYDNYLCSAD